MTTVILLFLAPVIVPPMLFWAWICRLDAASFDPRPFATFFIAGGALAIPLVPVEHVLELGVAGLENPAAWALARGFVVAALPEETARAAFLAYFLWKRRGFSSPRWIISAAVALAMGQVLLENALMWYAHVDQFEQFSNWILRALFCVPTLGFYGFAVGVAAAWRHARCENWAKGLLSGLAIAIVAHGLYDAAVFYAEKTLAGVEYAEALIIPLAAAVVSLCWFAVRSRCRDLGIAG
jgi:RsiW-degrading membrane proteinase PrsW (M82 family)